MSAGVGMHRRKHVRLRRISDSIPGIVELVGGVWDKILQVIAVVIPVDGGKKRGLRQSCIVVSADVWVSAVDVRIE